MRHNNGMTGERLRYVHEILFAANVAFAGVTLVFSIAYGLSLPFLRMNHAISDLLHIKQTDYVTNYFGTAIATLLLMICVWVLLRLFSRAWITKELLRSVAGIVVLFITPAFWFYANQRNGWEYGWPYRWAPFEIAVVVVCVVLFLAGKWPVRGWIALVLLAGHYIFWFWLFSTAYLASYVGPAGPILGFSSAVIWGLYVTTVRCAAGDEV